MNTKPQKEQTLNEIINQLRSKIEPDKNKLEEKVKAQLTEYKNAVELLANFKSDFIFSNFDSWHASIVLTSLIKYSKNIVRIYDDALDGDMTGDFDYFGELLPAMEEHIRSKKVLHIIVRDGDATDSKVFRLLQELSPEYKDTLSVKKASQEFMRNITDKFGNDINFATADDSAYRIEEYEKGVQNRKAVVNFNQISRTQELNEAFDFQFNEGEDVFYPHE